jgi:hypothetical protein
MKTGFKEEIHLVHRTFMIIFILLAILCLWFIIQEPTVALAGLLFIIILIAFLFGKMLIAVDDNELTITFGYIKVIGKRIPLSDIKSAEVVTYRPIRNFGGWGIRCGRFRGQKTACLSLKGNRGVLFILAKSQRFCMVKIDKLIVGSQEPERLLEAIGRGEAAGLNAS